MENEISKKLAFEDYLNGLNRNIVAIEQKLIVATATLEDSKECLREASKDHKAYTETCESLNASLKNLVFEFRNIWKQGWEKWNPDLIEHCDSPVMSVGEFAGIIDRIRSGNLKSKGFSENKMNFIAEQFVSFWKKMNIGQTS